jgi:hypothetical protein
VAGYPLRPTATGLRLITASDNIGRWNTGAPPLRSYGAIWDWLREGRQKTDDADTIRKAARREFPASIARRWFQ